MLSPEALDKLQPAFNDVRPDEPAAERFAAWKDQGQSEGGRDRGGTVIAPEALDKLRPAFNDVRPDEPAAVPFLVALEAFLRRWYGVDFAGVARFSAAGFTHASKGKDGHVEVEVLSPSNRGHWAWDASFEGFGVDGVITVHLRRTTMVRSRCVRWWHDACEVHDREMDIVFAVVAQPEGEPIDRLWIVADGPEGER